MGFDVIHGGNPLLLGAGAFLSGQGKGLARAADYAHDDNMQARDMMARQQQQIFGHLSQIAAQKLAHIDALDMTNANHINALEKMDVAHQYAVDEHYQERYNRPYKELVIEAQKANMPFPEYVQQLDTKIAETQYMAKLKAQNMEIGLLPQEQAHNDAIQLRINQWKKNIEREFTPEEAAKGIAYEESQLIQPHPVPRKSVSLQEMVDGGQVVATLPNGAIVTREGFHVTLPKDAGDQFINRAGNAPAVPLDPNLYPGEGEQRTTPAQMAGNLLRLKGEDGIDYLLNPKTGELKPDKSAAEMRVKAEAVEQQRQAAETKKETEWQKIAVSAATTEFGFNQKVYDSVMANLRGEKTSAPNASTASAEPQPVPMDGGRVLKDQMKKDQIYIYRGAPWRWDGQVLIEVK